MENASKALIIAGAILLSILIIGIGMFIYQQAAGAVGDTGLDEQEIQAFNSKFEQYEGTASGSKVRALCDTIRNHNLANTDDESRQVYVEEVNKGATVTPITDAADKPSVSGSTYAAKATSVKAGLKAGYTYYVQFGYDKASGLICAVYIQQQ